MVVPSEVSMSITTGRGEFVRGLATQVAASGATLTKEETAGVLEVLATFIDGKARDNERMNAMKKRVRALTDIVKGLSKIRDTLLDSITKYEKDEEISDEERGA